MSQRKCTHLKCCLQRSNQLISDQYLDRKKEEMKGGPYRTKQLETQPRNENVGDVSGEARSRTDSLK